MTMPKVAQQVPEIRYLNTDLELRSRCDLSPLEATLEERGLFSLGVRRRGKNGLWWASFEANFYRNPERSISMLLDVMESLAGAALVLWRSCTFREFNVGYESGSQPRAFNQGLSNKLVQRMAIAGASLRITIYPPDKEQ